MDTQTQKNYPLACLKSREHYCVVYYDCKNAETGFVGIDAGIAVPLTRITFALRPGYESRMVGGVFEGSNTSSAAGYTTRATAAATPKDGWTNLLTVAGGKSYLRYRGPANSDCDIAEVKFQNEQAPERNGVDGSLRRERLEKTLLWRLPLFCRLGSASGTALNGYNRANGEYKL